MALLVLHFSMHWVTCIVRVRLQGAQHIALHVSTRSDMRLTVRLSGAFLQ